MGASSIGRRASRAAKAGTLLGLLVAAAAIGCEPSAPTEDVGVQEGAQISNFRLVLVPGSTIRIATWNDTEGTTQVVPFYAIDLGDGNGWHEGKKTSYVVPLRTRALHPAIEVQSKDLEDENDGLHIVQFVSQPLEPFWTAIRATGATVHHYLHGNAQIVRGNTDAMKIIAALPFVRAVTPMVAADRIDPILTERSAQDHPLVIMLVDPKTDRALVESRITALGGSIKVSDKQGILIEATLDATLIPEVASLPQVLWVEQGQPIELDYDISRQQGGADFLESLPPPPVAPGASPVAQYTGLGIRGHILEGIDPNHPDFAATDHRVVPIAVDAPAADSHGMQTFGIVFGSGAGNARARGLLPNGQGYYTHNSAVFSAPAGGRSTLTAKLIADHKVMFQTASWGDGLVKTYTAKSAEMDALILKHDLPITQSQSNAGSQNSRPQAWAKNIISVGALYHYGTATPDDDKWNNSGSIGPAADGSIKPDLCFYYDKTITTALNNGYSNTFGGTSGATPTVAGHVGLTIELWTNGVFGNPIIAADSSESLTDMRFKNRPHATTTKALLIHSAKQHQFDGETHDRTRVHQGWGVPDLKSMYQRRTNMVVVNETDIVQNLDTRQYSIVVPAGAADVRATLVYADKEAAVPATIHRVNNLDLRVTAPDGTIYWGNNGLKGSMTSTPGGVHNTLDTVENVFVNNPAPGVWKVEVIADEINADTHLSTAATDSAFALVLSTAP